ncbi:MAG: EamA family transporter [Nitrospirae bacterium]|nr:EamA family transporter [Nitrospirota bacterium]
MWIVYALLSAFFSATTEALTKKSLATTDEYLLTWLRHLFAIPFLIAIIPFINIPRLDSTFWLTILLLLPLEITAIILSIKALKASPLSLTIPFLAFTPLFLILTSFLMLGETPDISGTIGILLIAVGAYTLNIHSTKEGLLEPIKSIAKERGSILMLIVAFIYSITSNLGKIAILHSSPIFFGIVYYIILAFVLTPIAVMKSNRHLHQIGPGLFNYCLIGLFLALMIIFHVIAITMTNVAYMISVKRTSLLFSVGFGYLLFNERNITERLLGSFLMIIGIMLISLF